MNRKAKQSGSGGRLRLGLLLATAAVFLLVPASQAFAAPELTVNLIGANGGGGEVKSQAPAEGSPKIECNLPAGGSQEGTCLNEMTEVAIPPTFEPFWVVSLKAFPGLESKVQKWDIVGGEIFAGCGTPGEPISLCTVKTEVETENIEVNAYFVDRPELTLNMISIGGGGGEVVSNPATGAPGTPEIACKLPEGGSQEGICENETSEVGPGTYATGLKVALEEIEPAVFQLKGAPNSEFVEWEIVPVAGTFLGPPCALDADNESCTGVSTGPDIELNAIFACKAGKVCPPPAPVEVPLEVTTSGLGSGTVVCKIDGGAEETCPAEVLEGSDVEAIATPDTGSEPAVLSGTGSAAACAASPCTFEMTEESSVNAEFSLETFALTLNPPIGEGTLEAECGGGACASLTEIPYETEVTVTATPDPLNSVASLTGAGSASGCSIAGVGPEEAATCEFGITADSEVSAEFVAAASIATDPGNVKGSVDQQTTLETEDCDDVDLGPFVPSASAEEYANDECVVTVTATGTENELRAADEEVIVPNGTNLTGHLTQEPGDPFTLDNALEVQGTGTTGGAAPSGYLPLSSTALLQDYGTPVSLDVVTVEFRQLIDAFEPLHTGTYDKTITLTLEQDVL